LPFSAYLAAMPRAEILTTQAMHTLRQLHAELGGKLLDNKSDAKRLTTAMKQVEAVMKLLQPGYNVRPISIRRRKLNPWFKRGTVLRHALDVLRQSQKPMRTREITECMLAARGIAGADPKAVSNLSGSVLASLRNYEGKGVFMAGEGTPAKWRLKSL
jgi:hypothetical protein